MEKAMKELENIDFTEIERDLRESMKHLEKEKFHINTELEKIEDLIQELDKLELKEE